MNRGKLRAGNPLILALILVLLTSSQLAGQLRTSPVFGNDMVLQRNQPLRIWGEAPPGAAVHLVLHTQISLAFADEHGAWEAVLGALPAGGPYSMQVYTDEESVTYQNIMLGEVWVCAGQSNMGWPLKSTSDGASAIQGANFPNIRYFDVPKILAEESDRNLTEGEWVICNPETVRDFSAVAFYFGRNLHENLDVAVGLIDITWGGTRIDTWISPDALAVFPDLEEELAALDNLDIAQVEDSIATAQTNWDAAVESTDIGLIEHWEATDTPWQDWPEMLLPNPWEADGLTNRDGSVWFKNTFSLTQSQANGDVILRLGKIDDSDETWVNGQLVGSTDRDPGAIRSYNLPVGICQEGENTVTVRVRDYGFSGGLLGGANDMKVHQDMWQVSLTGYWNYQIGTPELEERPPNLHPNDYPSLIFNGMVSAVSGLAMAGAIWYQGESDTGDPYHYRDKQIKLIDSWRQYWGIGDFPFLVVQLPYFRPPTTMPAESSWATIRESQTYALKRTNTAVIPMIDSGDAFDIHPNNKFHTGIRLAENARRMVYQESSLPRSPAFFLDLPSGNEMTLYFHTYGSSLFSLEPEQLSGFAIAGADGIFIPANARILSSQSVRVSHPDIPQPKYVRYAWADNPGFLNLSNAAGLPVRPFRTDILPTPYE